ncbi:MAG: IS1634 family transposase [Candidatus Aminicenantes bacterium]|nr:IS1634 family transposase [Candidatus Aminicenantes bacterium]
MYLRTTSRKNQDGSSTAYLQIAENVWDPIQKRSTVKVLCTLGRADGKAVDRLQQLARSIRKNAPWESIAELEEGWTFVNSWKHGPFAAINHLWKQAGLEKIIEQAVKKEDRTVPFERAIFAMVANRCLEPSSKLDCYERWMSEEVYFPEGKAIALHHLYRAMDFLSAHKKEIEEEIYWQTADLLNMDVDLIFYDTTSVSFEIDWEDDEGLRKRGYSKEGRPDAPQIVVGMVVTRDGYPVKTWVFPGNTADVTTISRVKSDLKGWRLNRCVFVADAGMVSENNLRELSKGGGRYIVAMPCRKGTEVVEDVLSRPGRFKIVADNLQVKEVWVGEGVRRRRYVVCFNPLEAERQKKHREEVLRELEAEIASLRGHPKKSCRLLSSRRFGPYLRTLKSGELRISCGSVRARAKRDGLWVIHSNDEELSAEDLALAYKQLMRVEEAWRTMKSTIRIDPVYHRKTERIEAHVFLCSLALLLERIAEKACGLTWKRIREELRTIKVGQLLSPHGTVYQASPGSMKARNLLKKMGMESLPSILNAE